MVKDYLIELKNKGDFSWSDLSKLSGLPDATIRKIFSGETSDPRFETVVKLVTAMGGSMNELLGQEKGDETEMNAINAIREVYEARIADLKHASMQLTDSLSRDKRILTIIACILGGFLAALLLCDFFIGSVGWIRY